MSALNHKNRSFFSGTHLLGSIFLFAGILSIGGSLIFSTQYSEDRSLIIGAVGISFGLFILNTYSGTIIDCQNRKYCEYFRFIGFGRKVWIELPALSSVKLVPVEVGSSNTPNGISPTLSGNITEYRITLWDFQENEVLSLSKSKKAKAISIIEKLSTELNIEKKLP